MGSFAQLRPVAASALSPKLDRLSRDVACVAGLMRNELEHERVCIGHEFRHHPEAAQGLVLPGWLAATARRNARGSEKRLAEEPALGPAFHHPRHWSPLFARIRPS